MTLTEKIKEAEDRTRDWVRGRKVKFPYEKKLPIIGNRYSQIEVKGVIVKDKKSGNKIVWKKI